MATDVYLIRNNNLTWAKYEACTAVELTGNGAVADMKIWSSEFRDQFQMQGSVVQNTTALGFVPLGGSFSIPGSGSLQLRAEGVTQVAGVSTAGTNLTSSITNESDEVAHAPLRQTLLNASFWKFDMGASTTPRHLYASYQDGDIIANNPPQTA